MQTHYQNMAQNLRRTLVFNNGIMPLGLLRSCMEYALNDNTKIDGVFQAVKEKFRVAGGRDLLTTVTECRNGKRAIDPCARHCGRPGQDR